MTLQERIDIDYKDAFKRHEKHAVDAFRMLKTAVKNAEIEARHELSDDETMAVIAREAKRRRESVTMFKQGNRPDLVETETAQLKVIERYLPAQMSDEDLTAVIKGIIAETSATVKDFGKVMGAAMAKVKGQADGSRVTAIVKANLK
jgi:uncharacterized protein YqeY